jgi:hypothetical protein
VRFDVHFGHLHSVRLASSGSLSQPQLPVVFVLDAALIRIEDTVASHYYHGIIISISFFFSENSCILNHFSGPIFSFIGEPFFLPDVCGLSYSFGNFVLYGVQLAAGNALFALLLPSLGDSCEDHTSNFNVVYFYHHFLVF